MCDHMITMSTFDYPIPQPNLPKVVLILSNDPSTIHHVFAWTKCYTFLILAKVTYSQPTVIISLLSFKEMMFGKKLTSKNLLWLAANWEL